jgi:hypothetical protein
MLRLADADIWEAEPVPPVTQGRTRGRDQVHCFVEAGELRRLLCLLAGTELLGEIFQNLRGRSAREV